jgi:hypothetical protein
LADEAALTVLAALADEAALTGLAAARPVEALAVTAFADPADEAAAVRLTAETGLATATAAPVRLLAAGAAAPVVAARVGAFLGTAMGKFLLANDCGLVSAWRQQDSGLDTGVEPV